MPETGPANAYKRLVESRVWQEQRMPAVVLAATGLMAIVGMGSVAVAASGWTTTTEVSVDGVTMTPSAAAPQIGVAVQTTIGPDGRPVATVMLSPVPGTPQAVTPVPVASISGTPVPVAFISGTPIVILPAPGTPAPVPSPVLAPVSETPTAAPSVSPPPPVETTASPAESPSPVTEATSAPVPTPVP
ncbi:hypothetical protein [Catenuloplanes japonicus]|uniref:hypothetical protein n=1 Tax=Catenuloplanes japonicus TaxID=33876 RepID=UPI0012FB4FDB|nr:hypothetical protein [Catenuloplanes japonicus]